MSLRVIRHRSASSLESGCWEYDPARQVVMLAIRTTDRAPIVTCDVDVCAYDQPRLSAYVIRRTAEDAWRILPAIYVRVGARMATHAHPIHAVLGMAPVLLACAPSDVVRDLEQLEVAR